MTCEERGRRLPAFLTLAVTACVLLSITVPQDWLRWHPEIQKRLDGNSKWLLQDQQQAEPKGEPSAEESTTSVAMSQAAVVPTMAHFQFHGNGSCETGYYSGWGTADSQHLESCKLACSADPACTFISFKKGVTCSRFDATAGTCRNLQYHKDGYTTYRRIWRCDWSEAVLQTGRRCSQSFENWKGGPKEAMLAFCASTSYCKGVHWFHEGGRDIRNISKGWFQACTGVVSAGQSTPWSTLVKPKSCAAPSDHRPLTKVSVPGTCSTTQVVASPGKDLKEPLPPSKSVELVISAFNENLHFIEPMLAIVGPDVQLKLYCSGDPNLDSRCMAVPNLGGENAVYLHHIVQNYHSLADITVFSVGSIMRNENNQLLCRKLNYVLSQLRPSQRESFRNFSTMAHTFPGEFNPFNPAFDIETYASQKWGHIRLCNASVRPLGAWYQSFVDKDLQHATCVGVLFNDIFAVRADRLRRWPQSTYEALLAEMSRCGDLRSAADHYMERSWKAMLDDAGELQPGGINKCPIEGMIRDYCLQQHGNDEGRCPRPQGN